MIPARAKPGEVVGLLEKARTEERSGLAFDADGTLWSGDVGDDTFHYVCERELLRVDAAEELSRVARAHDLDDRGTPSAVALRLFDGYRRGVVAESLMCEVMAWSFAGFTDAEVTALAEEALASVKLAERRHAVLSPIFTFAADEALRVVVVSASPYLVVEAGLRAIGLTVDGLAAAVPASDDGRIVPRMAAPLTYGPEKPIAGRRLLAEHDWLGSFGDNAFDVEMLRAAKVGVAVHPKPALVRRLAELTNTVVLE